MHFKQTTYSFYSIVGPSHPAVWPESVLAAVQLCIQVSMKLKIKTSSLQQDKLIASLHQWQAYGDAIHDE